MPSFARVVEVQCGIPMAIKGWKMQVTILRHGQTAGNREGRYIGATDEPLCEAGISALRQLAGFADIGRVYVSPLQRTHQTAELLFPGARQIIIDDLREIHFGSFEGRTALEMRADAAYQNWVESECLTVCPGGESFLEFTQRVCVAFSNIIDEAVARGEDAVHIVAHGGSIMSIMSKYVGDGRAYHEWYVKNGCGYRAQLDTVAWPRQARFLSYELLGESNVWQF